MVHVNSTMAHGFWLLTVHMHEEKKAKGSLPQKGEGKIRLRVTRIQPDHQRFFRF